MLLYTNADITKETTETAELKKKTRVRSLKFEVWSELVLAKASCDYIPASSNYCSHHCGLVFTSVL